MRRWGRASRTVPSSARRRRRQWSSCAGVLWLPLDDMLGCLRERLPQLSRSALHRCLVRHGISRLPRDGQQTSRRRRFPDMPIGSVHIDSSELRLAQGKLHMFLAIDRVTKFTHGIEAA